jgi:hypothetical protein
MREEGGNIVIGAMTMEAELNVSDLGVVWVFRTGKLGEGVKDWTPTQRRRLGKRGLCYFHPSGVVVGCLLSQSCMAWISDC